MKVAAEAGRLKREGVDVVDFSAGEPDFPTPTNIKNAAIDALNKNFTKYTPISGTPELKQAICDFHKDSYGTSYKPATYSAPAYKQEYSVSQYSPLPISILDSK